MAITAETRADIIELVVTAYNAAPGTTLLNELVAIIDGGGTLADVATNLTTRSEWTTKYPAFQTAEEFAAEWLGNLVPEASAESMAEGKTITTGLINGGSSFADILLVAQGFLSTLSEDDESFGTSAANFNNKVEVATKHTITNEVAAMSESALTGVTSDDATVTTANDALDAPAAVASQTYTLLTGLDDKTLGGGNDSAFAVDSTTAASDTFNVSDAVDGGAGTDTFYLTIDSIGAGQTYTPSRLTNFENFSITNIGGNSMTTNVSLIAPTGIEVSASTNAVNVTKVTAGSPITVTGNTAAVNVTHKNAGLVGTSDSVSIAMTGNTGGLDVDSDGAQDIESATITATGINSGSLVIGDNSGNSTITSLTVDGAGALTIGGGDLATLTSLDASANTGGVTYTTQVTTEAVTLTGGAGNDTLTGNTGDDVITGGAGNDTLSLGSAGGDDHIDGGAGDDTITVAGVTKDDTIAGGEGEDTLTINTALAYSATTGVNNAAGVSGFEVLDVETSLSQVMTPLSGITSLSVGAGDTATLTKVAGITSVTLKPGASASADLTLATDGTADDLTVNLGSDVTQTASTSTSLDAVEYETMTVSSVGADSNAVTIKADALTGLTVTGSKDVTINLNPDTGTTTLPLTTIDASAATGTVNVQASSADSGVTVTPGGDAITVNLGDGADTVTGTSKTAGDSITTGKGNDTVTGAGGNDTVNSGAGDDTVTLLGGDNNVTLGTGADTLTAGDGNNTVTNTSGNSTVTLGGGTNGVTNTAGNLTLVTGGGVDTVTNTAGNASITTAGGGDIITNTAGNSTIISGDGNDSVTLTAGNSSVTAGAGNDTISLGSGNDTVDGGDGTDTATFSHGTGIYASTISNVETVTGTMTASGTIDLDNITGVSTLKVTANATVASLTVKDIVSGTTINVGDDLAEDSSAGDIQALTVDTAAEATMTLKVLGNQEAALPVAADFTSTTFTDVDNLTISADGGANVDQVITHDLESVALDTADTTSLTINTAANGGINIGTVSSSAVLDSLTVTTAAEGDFNMEGLAEADALSSISMTATGDASIVFEDIGSTTGAILDTLTITAQSGGDVDMLENNIESTVDMTSMILTADGAGSTITMEGDYQSEGAITTLTFAATDGGVIEGNDAETFDFTTINSWTIETDGTGSTFTMEGIATGDADIETLTIDSQGAAANIDIGGAEVEADIDTLAISVGSYATLTGTTLTAFEDEVGMESFSFVVADNGIVDTTSAGSEANDGIYVKSASFASLKIDIGASTTIEEDMLSIQSTGEEGAVTDFDLDIEAGTSAVTVDLNAIDANPADDETDLADTIIIGTTPVVLTADDAVDGETDGTGVLGWAEGNITLTGSGAHTVDLGEASGAFTVNTGSGADTITMGDGNDTISMGAGGDTVNITATGSGTITGGTGADDFSFNTGAEEQTSFGTTTITDFLDGTDDLSISVIGTNIAGSENAIAAARAQAELVDNGITAIAIDAESVSLDSSGDELITDFEDMTDVAAYLNEGYTAEASDEAGIILNDGTNSYFYLFLDGGDTGIESDEIQLVAKVNGIILDVDNVS